MLIIEQNPLILWATGSIAYEGNNAGCYKNFAAQSALSSSTLLVRKFEYCIQLIRVPLYASQFSLELERFIFEAFGDLLIEYRQLPSLR